MAGITGKTRITKLATAILRAGGVVTFETAMAMLGENKQATSRTLKWLVEAGMLRKIRTPGAGHVWMSERPLVRTFDSKEKPAVYKLSRHTDRWVPGPTFDHDQLALRVLFSLAEPWDLLTEHEIRSIGTWNGRVPDGVMRLGTNHQSKPVIVELEVETSRKTGALYRPNGTQGGWAKLAERLYSLSHNWIGGREPTSLGMTEQTLIVAPRNYAVAIVKKICELHQSNLNHEGPIETCWHYVELMPDGTLGPIRCYRANERNTLLAGA